MLFADDFIAGADFRVSRSRVNPGGFAADIVIFDENPSYDRAHTISRISFQLGLVL
jgi:hypothetical protein